MNEAADDRLALNDEEMRVLELLADGLSDERISAELGVSTQVLDGHVTNVLQQLDSRSRTEAAIKAIRRGLVGEA